MNRYVLPNTVLVELRTIGDPALESAHNIPTDPRGFMTTVGTSGLVAALASVGTIKTNVMRVVTDDGNDCLRRWQSQGIDVGQCVKIARGLFTRAGDEICAALLLAGLPETYATKWGAPVLVRHGGLVNALPSRIRETALFLMSLLSADDDVVANGTLVSAPSESHPSAAFVETCAGLRLFHHVLRDSLKGQNLKTAGTPINQEDLLGTMLTFTITAFRVLDTFGIDVSDDERDAYFVFWDLVGACLGIGTLTVLNEVEARCGERRLLRPPTVDIGTLLLAQLHARQWAPVQDSYDNPDPFPWSGLVDGRTLTNALLGALAAQMPDTRKSWPATVMRELAPEPVRARLGLDREGMGSYVIDRLADRFAGAQRARGASLRMMANEITRRAMEAFLRTPGPPFDVAGLDLKELT